MNYELYRYIDCQMDDSEKQEFEKRLSRDAVLKAEYDSITSKMNQLKHAAFKELTTDSAYFNNITVNFRKNIDKQKAARPFYITKYAFALPTLIIVFMVSVLFFSKHVETKASLNQIIEEYSDSEKRQLIDEIGTGDYSAEVVIPGNSSNEKEALENKIADELNIDDETYTGTILVSVSDLTKVPDNLSDKEESNIYNEIINKKIL